MTKKFEEKVIKVFEDLISAGWDDILVIENKKEVLYGHDSKNNLWVETLRREKDFIKRLKYVSSPSSGEIILESSSTINLGSQYYNSCNFDLNKRGL